MRLCRASIVCVSLLLAAAPCLCQDIRPQSWRQIDVGEATWGTARWESKDSVVRLKGEPGRAAIEIDGFRSFFIAGQPELAECTFRCVFVRAAQYDERGLAQAPFGLVVRWRDTKNYYAVQFTGADELRLLRVLDGDQVVLATAPEYAPVDVETALDVQLLGTQIRVRLNGRLIMECADAAIISGHVGFCADRGASLRFERLSLYTTASAPFLYVPLLMTKVPYVLRTGPDEATILWETNRPVAAEVTYGVMGNEEQFSVTAPASDRLQKVTLTGLASDTQYVYKVKAEARNRGGGEFHTGVLPGDPFSAGFIGDTKTYPERFKRFAGMLLERRPNFVIHLGDVVDTGTRLDEWDEFFFKPAEALLGRIPAYVTIGNHDESPNRKWFNTYFPYSGAVTESGDKGRASYFAFTYGNAAFAILDNYFDLTPGSAQYAWFEEQLRSVAFQAAMWRIVCCHEPPYGIERAQWRPGNAAVRDYVLPLCRDYGVQLLVAGHEHSYKRTLVDGVIVVVNGGGGCGYGTAVSQRNGVAQFAAQLLGFATLQYGVMRFEGPRLDWTCFNSEDKPIDRFVLENGGTQPVLVER